MGVLGQIQAEPIEIRIRKASNLAAVESRA